MKLHLIELIQLRIPLLSPFVTSFGTQTRRDALLVHVSSDSAEGWGECVALAAPVYSPEYAHGAAAIIEQFFAPVLLGQEQLSAADVAPLLQHFYGHQMAKAAVEAAVLDAELRAQQLSFAAFLGAERDRVPSGVSVGIQASIERLVEVVAGYLAEGYQRIKIKIQPGWDVAPVSALRAEFGDIPLQVDANSAYTLDDIALLRDLDQFELLLIEQPLYEDDIRLHGVLAAQLSTPVCLDESILSLRSAADAIALRAAGVINIKPGRVGGYLEAVRIHDLAVRSGVPVWCGGMLETGVGRAANAALAALPGFSMVGDISASDRFYAQDITEPVLMQDGWIEVPSTPGLGRVPLPDVLAEFEVSRTRILPG